MYATVPNAVATKATARMAIIADENSGTECVGVGVGDADGNVIPLLVGTQIASTAAPLVEVGT